MLIAITGGIGAGKTTILNQFQNFGAPAIDSDDIAHQLYLPGQPAFQAICQRWGTSILTEEGRLDRARIAQIVFEDSQEREWLNSLMHPLIQQEILSCAQASAQPLFCAIPLLYESGWESIADKVIAVWCDPATQMERLIARGWSREHAQSRLGSQWPPDAKMRKAEYAIISTCSWQHLEDQCRMIYQSICQHA